MNGYICYYKDRRVEIYASTTYQAQQLAVETFTTRGKAPKRHEITVVLAEKDGELVIYNGTEFGS